MRNWNKLTIERYSDEYPFHPQIVKDAVSWFEKHRHAYDAVNRVLWGISMWFRVPTTDGVTPADPDIRYLWRVRIPAVQLEQHARESIFPNDSQFAYLGVEYWDDPRYMTSDVRECRSADGLPLDEKERQIGEAIVANPSAWQVYGKSDELMLRLYERMRQEDHV